VPAPPRDDPEQFVCSYFVWVHDVHVFSSSWIIPVSINMIDHNDTCQPVIPIPIGADHADPDSSTSNSSPSIPIQIHKLPPLSFYHFTAIAE
jgi:hypothetical protein